MKIRFFNHQEWGVDQKAFRPLLLKLKKSIQLRDGGFNVVFVGDAAIQRLNKKYRHKNKLTDVLSFNYGDESETAGEIYISVETAQRQAKELGHSLEIELNKLFVHGILHLHGYDHETDKDYEIMHAIECKLLGSDIT